MQSAEAARLEKSISHFLVNHRDVIDAIALAPGHILSACSPTAFELWAQSLQRQSESWTGGVAVHKRIGAGSKSGGSSRGIAVLDVRRTFFQ